MNLFADIRVLVIDALDAMVAQGALPGGLSLDNVTVEPPRDAAHGDMATNAAMVLAKPAGMPPRKLAESIINRVPMSRQVDRMEIAGPGFINSVGTYWNPLALSVNLPCPYE